LNDVDVYNVTSRSWSTAVLSAARTGLAAASVGDVAVFGGGFKLIESKCQEKEFLFVFFKI
jgi:hypothetical protein